VELDLGGGTHARRGRKVHARVADRGGDAGERARFVLDLDDQVVRNRYCTLSDRERLHMGDLHS